MNENKLNIRVRIEELLTVVAEIGRLNVGHVILTQAAQFTLTTTRHGHLALKMVEIEKYTSEMQACTKNVVTETEMYVLWHSPCICSCTSSLCAECPPVESTVRIRPT